MIDRKKTLTEIEADDWGKPTYPSHLVTTCHEMRYKPIGELTDDEIRTAIGQQFSLDVLIPLAFERLKDDPWLEAEFYPGDLLLNVLRVNEGFWLRNPALWRQADQIVSSAMPQLNTLELLDEIKRDFRDPYAQFLSLRPAG